jgi:SAM-dependent methyltransferase
VQPTDVAPSQTSSNEVLDRGRDYRLLADGRVDAERDRLTTLEALFDPTSRLARGLVQPGWRCLEVGGGHGSMARWLAEQVGPDGEVVATDIDARYLKELRIPNLRALQHDILNDDLADLGQFDLVCSRLMLYWLRDGAQTAVDRMASLVRPGGWLVDEDGDWGSVVPIDPTHPATGPHRAAYRDGGWFADMGLDPWVGRKLSVMFERAGLERISHTTTSEVIAGGSAWGEWWADSIEVVGAQSPGMSPDVVRAVSAPFRDPTARFMTALLHGCRGRRPTD